MRTCVLGVCIAVLAAIGPLHAQDKKQKEKPAATSRTIQADLQTQTDFPNNEQVKFSEVLGYIRDTLKKKGIDVAISVDEAAYREEAPDAPPLFEHNITFRSLPAKATVKHLLREAVKQLPVKSAMIVRAGRVDIVPVERASKEYMLNQTVDVDFKRRALDDALDELSELTGVSIVIDGRVGDKQQTLVTARFRDDVAVQDAVRMLAEMGDLKVVYLVTGLYITTPERAKVMQKELRDLYEPAAAPPGAMPVPPGGIGPGLVPNGGIITMPSPLAPPLPPSRNRRDIGA